MTHIEFFTVKRTSYALLSRMGKRMDFHQCHRCMRSSNGFVKRIHYYDSNIMTHIQWLIYNDSSKIKVNNVELMVFVTVQEKVMHSMTKVNVFHGINAQVIHSISPSFTWLILESSDMTHRIWLIGISLGYAPECPPNEVYNDCNKGYEPFCCEQSMNEAQSRQFAQVIHSDWFIFNAWSPVSDWLINHF